MELYLHSPTRLHRVVLNEAQEQLYPQHFRTNFGSSDSGPHIFIEIRTLVYDRRICLKLRVQLNKCRLTTRIRPRHLKTRFTDADAMQSRY
jgi:hypothetical protein